MFLAFEDRAKTSRIQSKDPELMRHLESAAERLAGLVKNSAQESDAEEESDRILSAEVADDHEMTQTTDIQSAQRSGSEHVPMLGYQTIFDEETGNDDGETARQASAQLAAQQSLPLLDLNTTEAMQQPQSKFPAAGGVHSNDFGQLQDPVATSSNDITLLGANGMLQDGLRVTNDGTVQNQRPFSEFQPEVDGQRKAPNPIAKPLSDMLTLPLPATHSFQEDSFARRLLRTALEAGYRFLTDPRTSPEEIRRRWAFTWCFAKTGSIRQHIKGLLDRTAKQNLEHWDFPSLHLGGAGFHYPRIGIDAGGAPPDWWASQAPIGPLPPSQPETPMPENMMFEQMAERVGFGGEWFDSNDVEQYLQTKGLCLDEQSSLIEVHHPGEFFFGFGDAQDPLASSCSSSQEDTVGPGSPGPEMARADDPGLQRSDYVWDEDFDDESRLPDLNMDISYGDVDPSGPKASIPLLSEFSLLPTAMPTCNTSPKAFVDVDKFLDSTYRSEEWLSLIANAFPAMARNAVCLGRGPGFRRTAVDSALISAMTKVS